MPPELPQGVIDMMAERAHRMHHYLWHTVRNGWLRFSAQTQQQITALGWKPPRPALRPKPDGSTEPILHNASGEDFFYMHRGMIAAVNKKLSEIGDAAYPKLEGWPAPPGPTDPDWPVPSTYSLKDAKTDASIAECKSDAFFAGKMTDWMRAYTDPATLRRMSLGELGSRVESTIHNRMHMRWSVKPARRRPDVDPAAPDAINTSWDDPAYNWLGDTYSAHVNPTFWKLHGWVDRCIDGWMQANNNQGPVTWTGTWVGPMPDDAPAKSVFAHMRKHDNMHGPHHLDHMINMLAVAKVLRSSGVACHFYDDITVPPLPTTP
jgi:hypothetical protein